MDDFKKTSPKLSKLKKENPFGTPNKYFDDFSARFQMKLEAEKRIIPNKQNPIIRFIKPALGLAASFAFIFIFVYWPLRTFIPNQIANQTITQPDLSEMEYASMVERIDENSFYVLLDDPNSSVKFTDDDLISYLSTNISEYDIYYGTNNY